jgi:hypothetical protein
VEWKDGKKDDVNAMGVQMERAEMDNDEWLGQDSAVERSRQREAGSDHRGREKQSCGNGGKKTREKDGNNDSVIRWWSGSSVVVRPCFEMARHEELDETSGGGIRSEEPWTCKVVDPES